MITADNIIRHELIGLDVTIEKSSNKNIEGVSGTIVNETKSMFTLNINGNHKMFTKKDNVWAFNINGKTLVNGANVCKRPQDRVRVRK